MVDFFIVGFPRSGTTLLTNLLNNTGNIKIPPETRYYEEIYNGKSKISGFEVCKKISISERFGDFISIDDVAPLFDDKKLYSHGYILNLLLKMWGGKTWDGLIGEKSPVHQMHIDLISKEHPNAKFIYIHRDPRDVVNSVINAGWGYKNYYYLSALYRYRFKKTESLANYLRKKNKLIDIKFEDLVMNPGCEINKIKDFLNIIEIRNLDYNNLKNMAVPEWELKWKKGSLKKINNGHIYLWKNGSLTKKMLNSYSLLQTVIEKLDYPTQNHSNSIGELVYYYYNFVISSKELIKSIANKFFYFGLRKGNSCVVKLKEKKNEKG